MLLLPTKQQQQQNPGVSFMPPVLSIQRMFQEEQNRDLLSYGWICLADFCSIFQSTPLSFERLQDLSEGPR